MQLPVLREPIPFQVTNEQAAYGPFDLTHFVDASSEDGELYFEASLVTTGESLPKGLICTRDGIITGIPAKGTQGIYEINLVIGNDVGSIEAECMFEIKPSLASDVDYYTQLKRQVWEALEQRLPVPELTEIYDRPISPLDIYYLLERWGVIKIWDAFNLDEPGELVPLDLSDASPHYHVYDRGSCLVAGPKDLFSHDRTIEDSLQTARALTREAYKRNWTIEIAGLDKVTRAIWVEAQTLSNIHGREMDVTNYRPSKQDEVLVTLRVASNVRPSS